MRTILLIVCCLAFLPLAGFCQNSAPYSSPQWFDDIGNAAGSATATAMQVDASGNSYVTGNFSGTVDFDPSNGASFLAAPAGTTSGFVAKYKSDGTLVWAYILRGNGTVTPNGIAIISDGSIAITGKYTASVDANPDTFGVDNLNAAGGNDAFIIHLDNNGTFLWAKSIGDTGEDVGNRVAGDASGNIYVAMQFQGTVLLTSGGTPYTAKGTTDGMLVKYDAAGNVVFAIDLGYAGNAFDNTVSGVVVDKNGNVDVIGYINGPIDFNPLGTTNPVSNAHSMYLAQYTAAGILKWVKTVANGFQTNNNINLAIDGSNSIYISGSFTGQITFANADNLTARGTQDVFMAQYFSDGTLRWHKNIGGTGANLSATAIGVSPDNQTLYLSGYFTGAANFDTGSSGFYLTYSGQKDIFLAKYTASTGDYRDAVNFGNNSCSSTQSNGMAVTTNGDVMLTGAFCANTNFSGASCTEFNEQAQSTAGKEDMFLVRYTLVSPIANNAIGNPQNCPGAPAGPLILTGSTPTGGTGIYTYEWQRSTDGMTYVDIGAYDKDYPAPTSNSLVYYIRKVFSGCATPSISSVLQVGPSVNGPVQNNVIDGSGIVEGCGGAGSTALAASLPTGGGGNYTYLWQTSRNKIDWTDVVEGPITTPYSQNLGAISYLFTFYVRRLVMTPGCNTPSISPVVTFPAIADIANYTTHATKATVFCGSGDPGTLTLDKPVTGGTGSYTYQWKSTTTNDYQDIPGATGLTYSPGVITTSTHFTIEVRSGPCYTGDPGKVSNPIDITIIPLVPVANNTIAQATPDGVLCRANADPSLITGSTPAGGSGSVTFQWQQSTDKLNFTDIGGATGKDLDPKVITATTYYRRTVNSSGANSCSLPSLSNVVTVNVATAAVSGNTISQTVADPSIICSIPADPKAITGSDAVGSGFTYQWQSSVDGTNFTDIIGFTSRDYDPPAISQTTYYRRAAPVPDKCVTPSYSNVITIAVSPTATSNTITSPKDTVFCDAGDAAAINGSDVTGNGVHYQWQSSPDNITYTDIVDQNGPEIYQNYDPPLSTTTVYYHRSVTTTVCNVPSVTRAIAIQVFKTPVAKVSADSVTLCAGSTVTLTASGGANYKWSPAKGLSSASVASPIASPDSTTIYQVAVSNGGCSVNAAVKVIVIPKPVVDAGPDQKVFRGETVQLKGKIKGNNVQYSWLPASYLDDPTVLSPKATPPSSITYTLTAITNYGCNIITDDVHLEVYEKVTVPTAFTPNNDGKNDTWEIVGLSTYPRSVTTIFNRDGMQLFRSVGYSKPWDGTFNGKPMPFGTYYYVIDLKDGFKLLSGWVALVK